MADFRYLGTALKHPVTLQNGKGVIEVGLGVIEQSIAMILATPIGSRFMLPEFGSRLHELMFEQNDDVLKGLIRQFAFESLKRWEKRCNFVDIDFDLDENRVDVIIKYIVLPSNEIRSYVYPFYRELEY